jgi:hypothetical protein
VYQGTVAGQPVAIKKPRMVGGDEHAQKVRRPPCASTVLMAVFSDCVARRSSGASSGTQTYFRSLASTAASSQGTRFPHFYRPGWLMDRSKTTWRRPITTQSARPIVW